MTTGAIRPIEILMDLNFPRVDGREILARIKGDQQLHRIPMEVIQAIERFWISIVELPPVE